MAESSAASGAALLLESTVFGINPVTFDPVVGGNGPHVDDNQLAGPIHTVSEGKSANSDGQSRRELWRQKRDVKGTVGFHQRKNDLQPIVVSHFYFFSTRGGT
jgi:hypothetical protein